MYVLQKILTGYFQRGLLTLNIDTGTSRRECLDIVVIRSEVKDEKRECY